METRPECPFVRYSRLNWFETPRASRGDVPSARLAVSTIAIGQLRIEKPCKHGSNSSYRVNCHPIDMQPVIRGAAQVGIQI